MDNEKRSDFWGGGCREMEIQGVIVEQNSACVCVLLGRNIPQSLFSIFSANAVWF